MLCDAEKLDAQGQIYCFQSFEFNIGREFLFCVYVS